MKRLMPTFHWGEWQWDLGAAIYISVVVISAAVMAVLFALIIGDRNDLRREANVRATQIQQQRYDATYNTCMDTNRRNRVTIHRLNKLITNDVKKEQLPEAQAKQAEKQNRFLIDGILPVRNCKEVAAKAVHALPPPNKENP